MYISYLGGIPGVHTLPGRHAGCYTLPGRHAGCYTLPGRHAWCTIPTWEACLVYNTHLGGMLGVYSLVYLPICSLVYIAWYTLLYAPGYTTRVYTTLP